MMIPDMETALSADVLNDIVAEFQPLSPYGLSVAARIFADLATPDERRLFTSADLAEAWLQLNPETSSDERLFVGS